MLNLMDFLCEKVSLAVATNYTLVINAGGESRRMGRPKALLPVPPTGEPLLATIVRRLQGLTAEPILIIANDPQICKTVEEEIGKNVQMRWLTDRHIGVGPLGGIATVLAEVTSWALIVACDMPLLNPTLLRQLIMLAGEVDTTGHERWDAVVPVVNGYPEPLHALYHARVLPAVAARLAAEQRRATAFLPDVRVRYVTEEELRRYDPALHSFQNVNTPEEWALVCNLMAAKLR